MIMNVCNAYCVNMGLQSSINSIPNLENKKLFTLSHLSSSDEYDKCNHTLVND